MKNCIKLFLTGLIFMIYSCSDEINESDNPRAGVYFSFISFPDYNKTGVYLLDTRYLYQNILYHFDFEKEEWTVTGTGNGLPAGKRYSCMDVFESFSVSPDSILSVTQSGEVFSYDLKNKKWAQENYSKLINTRMYSFSSSHLCIYNEYDKHVYFFNLDYNLDIFVLGNDFKWQKKNTVRLPTSLDFVSFLDKDTIRLVDQKPIYEQDDNFYMPDFKYIADSLYVTHVNVSTGSYFTYKSMKVEKSFLNYYANQFFTVNKELYVLNSDSADYREIRLSRILLNNEEPFNTRALTTEEFSNPEDLNRWGEIYYDAKNRKKLYFYNNYYYLFVNEFPYKYSPETKQWTALEPCPFNALNKN